ncbi:MAG: alpha-galactosidase [Chthoniobacteraceae bacterium]|nr:alpha-galactosidase [Chthoniobacteraceae bacterium]
MITLHSEFHFAGMAVQYLLDDASHQIGLRLLPGDPGASVPVKDSPVDPLVHVFVRGEDRVGGFSNGRTMRGASPSLKFHAQHVTESAEAATVDTRLQSDSGYACNHLLSWRRGDEAVEVRTVFENTSGSPLTLEMVTSFSLGAMTPYAPGDTPGRLIAHRFRSGWSAEGRHDHLPVEALHLERSHSGAAAFSERFGQVGSMPVRGFFPFVAMEDAEEHVFWGAQLAWAGSWQMEIYRKYDDIALSGGLADREFGHWFKRIAPGERFEAPRAIMAVARGTIDHLCDRLTSVQKRAADSHVAMERDLPIVFNEWCTTWGKPDHEKILALADRLRGSDVKILVIDAGWYGDGNSHGEWLPCERRFPEGLAATARAIRDRGMIPGLWFEMETCTSASSCSLTDHLLQLDGLPITVGERRFWDMRQPWVQEHLAERVIGLLRDCGFGYLKVDYNDTLGIGCDGAESPGEGLRQQIEGVYAFFKRIHEALPDLIIENCSSGGHRLEPSMMALSAQASFSDAHENIEIPVIAANLHRLILPRQSQIWAVLRAQDDERRLVYSLAATLLGRMCLSGDLTELSRVQREMVDRACAFYTQAAPVIRDGFSLRLGPELLSFRHPQGWQAVLRTAGKRALVVFHAFAHPVPKEVEIDLPGAADWRIENVFGAGRARPTVCGGKLLCPLEGEFDAVAVLLETSR